MASFFQGAYGTKPNYANIQGLLTNPLGGQTPYGQLGKINPEQGQEINTASQNILSELQGNVPQDAQNQIKDAGAAWGLQTGMPGSGAAGNYTLEDLGLNSMQEQQTGLSNYLNFSPALQSQFTMNPGQTADTMQAIDVNEAAPNPDTAALANEMFKQMGIAESLPTSLM